MNNQIELQAIRELLGKHFFIPSYQRGYRWEKKQVTELLDDLREFGETEGKQGNYYCLQPIVVAQRKEGDYEVVDGQQRLTTILLILQCLKKNGQDVEGLYEVFYETREDSKAFLENIGEKTAEEAEANADYWHLYHAYKAIQEWFEAHGKEGATLIHKLLLDGAEERNVHIIWYEVQRYEERISVFNRLNIGKIPLTDAELIRALFLRQGDSGGSISRLEQEQIASAWDGIERKLQRPEFWGFLHNKKHGKAYVNRIDLVFDLVTAIRTGEKKKSSFDYFSQQLNAPTADIRNEWAGVKQCFLRLEEWYEDHRLYHYVGYLINSNTTTLPELYKLSIDKKRSEFVESLRLKIKKSVEAIDLAELTYPDDKDEIRRILLLFNIESLLPSPESEQSKTDVRFPFELYQEGSWDLEHIRSQTEYKNTTGQRQVIEAASDYYKDKPQLNEDEEVFKGTIENLLETHQGAKNIPQEEFKKVFAKLQAILGEDKALDEPDGLGNLALLNSDINRGYGNSPFLFKRREIIKKDKQATFIPIATRNVFLKYYSSKASDVLAWSQEDAEDYYEAIKEGLKSYIPKQEEDKNPAPNHITQADPFAGITGDDEFLTDDDYDQE